MGAVLLLLPLLVPLLAAAAATATSSSVRGRARGTSCATGAHLRRAPRACGSVCAPQAWTVPITVKVVLAGLAGDGANGDRVAEDALHTLVRCARQRARVRVCAVCRAVADARARRRVCAARRGAQLESSAAPRQPALVDAPDGIAVGVRFRPQFEVVHLATAVWQPLHAVMRDAAFPHGDVRRPRRRGVHGDGIAHVCVRGWGGGGRVTRWGRQRVRLNLTAVVPAYDELFVRLGRAHGSGPGMVADRDREGEHDGKVTPPPARTPSLRGRGRADRGPRDPHGWARRGWARGAGARRTSTWCSWSTYRATRCRAPPMATPSREVRWQCRDAAGRARGRR